MGAYPENYGIYHTCTYNCTSPIMAICKYMYNVM